MVPRQVVLVTGASTGFGRLIAETVAVHGHTVFATMRDVSTRNAANASELRALAKKEGLALHVEELDVRDEAAVDRTMLSCVEQAGRIDVVVNNAGYSLKGLAEATTIEQARRLMDTNFLGCARVNRAALSYMRVQHSGLLMHISSGAGRVVLPGFSYYCASKFALEALAEAYAYELAGQGIESCIVEPGAHQTAVFGNMVEAADTSRTDTYGAANQIAPKIMQALTSNAGNAQDLADAVLGIIETPAGQRKLRYRVSPVDLGVDEINAVCAQVQKRVIDAFGVSAETAFVQRSAARAS